MRGLLSLVLVVAMAFGTLPVGAAETGVLDPEVQKGILQVEEGEYDTAILTLDTASRRLAKAQGRPRDLAQAYLYLGIAYFGKGQEAAAKARFREAVREIGDLSLSPDKFPPRVINLFEAARDEVGSTRAAAPTLAAAAAVPPPAKGGGGGKVILIGAGVAAAAAAAVVAAGGGGGSSPTPPPIPAPGGGPPAPGGGTPTTETLQGEVNAGQPPAMYPMPVTGTGTLTARLTWTATSAMLSVQLFEVGSTAPLGQPRPTGPGSLELTVAVTPKPYVLHVRHEAGSPSNVSFQVVVTRP